MNQTTIQEELAKIDQAIAAQENLRGTLTDEQVEAMLIPLRQKRAELAAQLPVGSSGSVSLQNSSAGGSIITGQVSAGGDFAGGNLFKGNFQGAMVALGQARQNVSAAPHADPAVQEELSELLQKLQESLAQATPDRQEQAAAVATAATELVDKAQAEQPNKTSLQISGEGLKKAAQNLADIMPTVLTIATQIVTTIARFVP